MNEKPVAPTTFKAVEVTPETTAKELADQIGVTEEEAQKHLDRALSAKDRGVTKVKGLVDAYEGIQDRIGEIEKKNRA